MDAMFRRAVLPAAVAVALSGPAVAAGLVPAAAGAVRQPGAGSGSAIVSSVSCPAAGSCAAAGSLGPPGPGEVFVVSQARGVWGRAEKVRGLAALGQGGAVTAALFSVSCWSAGNCAAGGGFTDHADAQHAFVVNEANGVWGAAQQIRSAPGLHLGSSDQGPAISLMSCPSRGNCTAAGEYLTPAGKTDPFVASEANGRWGTAAGLPGVAALKVYLVASVSSLSCGSAGNCAVGGSYDDATDSDRSLVAVETNGTWGNAQQVPGTTARNGGISGEADSVSCPPGGGCLAAGFRATSSGGRQPFLSILKDGRWSRARPVPGLAALPGGFASGQPAWAGCTAAGDCDVIGIYTARARGSFWFSAAETAGTWGTAKKIPLGARADTSFINAVACPSPGNCSAGGTFTAPKTAEVFTVDEKNGTWSTSKELPGSVALNRGGDADIAAMACAAPGDCAAAGFYSPVNQRFDPLIATETHGTWGKAEKVPGLP